MKERETGNKKMKGVKTEQKTEWVWSKNSDERKNKSTEWDTLKGGRS